MTRFLLTASVLTLLSLGCGKGNSSSSSEPPPAAPLAAPEAHAEPRSSTEAELQPPYPLEDSSQIQVVERVGIYFVEKGNGPTPKPGSQVLIDYHGMLTDGSVFDSSFDQDGYVDFNLNNLIRGWQIGLTNVPTGSKVKLIIPPELGYGSQDRPGIPANSTLVFDIELVSTY
jgi:FKBP-type peptidyl-prolyl cis-trans isomerase